MQEEVYTTRKERNQTSNESDRDGARTSLSLRASLSASSSCLWTVALFYGCALECAAVFSDPAKSDGALFTACTSRVFYKRCFLASWSDSTVEMLLEASMPS